MKSSSAQWRSSGMKQQDPEQVRCDRLGHSSKQQKPVTALLDACVLAGYFKRNLLMSFAQAGLFLPVWSEKILSETVSASRHIYATSRGSLTVNEVTQQLVGLQAAFPNALVLNVPERPDLALPDPDDRHVVAAAIMAQAAMIVTDNKADFPKKLMKSVNIEIMSADDFLASLASTNREPALAAINAMLGQSAQIDASFDDLIKKLKRAGLKKTTRLLLENTAQDLR